MTELIKKQCEETFAYSCPVCRAPVKDVHYIYYQDGEEHKILRCQACSFMFARPVFLQKLEERQLDYMYDTELLNNSLLRKLHEKLIIGREVSYVRRMLGEGNFTLLDVGCGNGWTLNVWIKSGFKAVGIEPSKMRGRIASERYGVRIIPEYFENFTTSEKFDVVIMRHMIEHFVEPYEMIVKARSLLNPEGVLIVVVPNIDCIGRYTFGTKWTWGIPYHCNFFNPDILSRLLKRAGYDILKIYQTPSPLSYPESFIRLFPSIKKITTRVYTTLSIFTLFPFAPLVVLGFIMQLSENITVIATVRKG